MAIAALSTCLASAPGIAGAQAQGQLATLEEALRICSDPAILPGGWDAALAGWTPVEADSGLLARATADRLFAIITADGSPIEGLLLAGQLNEHLYLIEDYQYELEQIAEGNRDDVRPAFYSHDSGWRLAVKHFTDYPEISECLISHDRPDADVIAYLERPYLGASPYAVLGGRGLAVRARTPDGPGLAAVVYYSLFIPDMSLADSPGLPEGHPALEASAVSIEVTLNADSRGIDDDHGDDSDYDGDDSDYDDDDGEAAG